MFSQFLLTFVNEGDLTMADLFSAALKRKSVGIVAMMAVGSTLSIAANANASTLRITVENLTPTNGAVVTPLWFSLHDGSFDSFDVGAAASSGIMNLAEDGITGLEGTVPGLVDFLLANGLDPSVVPAPEDTIAGIFANSSAGINGGVQGIVVSPNPSNPIAIAPGLTASTTIKVNNRAQNRFFSYGAMLIPSNDGFFANGNPLGIEIFDASGKFQGAEFIVRRSQVWDAGTEVNDELPTSVPLTLDVVGQGTPETNVVRSHPGFLPPGGGGLADIPAFANFFPNPDDPNFAFFRVSVTQVPESSNTVGLLALGGLGLMGIYWRHKSSVNK